MIKRPLPIHPFLFAVWPVLFSLSQNVGSVSFAQAWRSIAILLGLALAMLIPFAVILRRTALAAAVVSLFFALFLSYGHVYSAIWGSDRGYAASEESMLLMSAWVVLFAGGAGLTIRLKKYGSEMTKLLNAAGVTLVLVSLANIGIYQTKPQAPLAVALAQSRELPHADPGPVGELPNIYYIVLDAYGRQDILEEVYQYDNSEFLGFLEENGFFIAAKARANYSQTELSLASSLKLGYLDEVAAAVGPDSNDHRPLRSLIQDGTVLRFLREQGYSIIGLPSGFGPTTLSTSDVQAGSGRRWNELEIGLLCSTPIPWLTLGGSLLDPYEVHRQKILDSFHLLAATADLHSPRFVFAHILAPHGPFVFDEHGNEVQPKGLFHLRDGPQNANNKLTIAEYREGYLGQLAFVSERIGPVIEHILSRAPRPTIIILQSDHGPESLIDWDDPASSYFKERLAILNAVRFPQDASIALYDEISPVNTFRLIFNHYFGTDLDQLEDISYFSSWDYPYRFIDVTEAVR